MPTFIPARGRTLHVAGVCINRMARIDLSREFIAIAIYSDR